MMMAQFSQELVVNEEAMDKLHVVFQETKEAHASSIASTKSSKIGITSSSSKDLSLSILEGPFGFLLNNIRGVVGN